MLVPERQFLNFFKKNFQKEPTLKFSPFFDNTLKPVWNIQHIFPQKLAWIFTDHKVYSTRPAKRNFQTYCSEMIIYETLGWREKMKINVPIPAPIRNDKIRDPHCLLYTGPVSPVRSKESWPTTRWQLYLCFHCNWICFDMAFYQVTIVCIALQELCF